MQGLWGGVHGHPCAGPGFNFRAPHPRGHLLGQQFWKEPERWV